MVKKILNIAFWVIIVLLLAVWAFDFIRVQSEKEPVFCLNKKVIKYDDGEVKQCTGLGYKIYEYDRASIDIKLQFAPFFIGPKE